MEFKEIIINSESQLNDVASIDIRNVEELSMCTNNFAMFPKAVDAISKLLLNLLKTPIKKCIKLKSFDLMTIHFRLDISGIMTTSLKKLVKTLGMFKKGVHIALSGRIPHKFDYFDFGFINAITIETGYKRPSFNDYFSISAISDTCIQKISLISTFNRHHKTIRPYDNITIAELIENEDESLKNVILKPHFPRHAYVLRHNKARLNSFYDVCVHMFFFFKEKVCLDIANLFVTFVHLKDWKRTPFNKKKSLVKKTSTYATQIVNNYNEMVSTPEHQQFKRKKIHEELTILLKKKKK